MRGALYGLDWTRSLHLDDTFVCPLDAASPQEFNPDCHLVKLGTMGEYGTPNIDIGT